MKIFWDPDLEKSRLPCWLRPGNFITNIQDFDFYGPIIDIYHNYKHIEHVFLKFRFTRDVNNALLIYFLQHFPDIEKKIKTIDNTFFHDKNVLAKYCLIRPLRDNWRFHEKGLNVKLFYIVIFKNKKYSTERYYVRKLMNRTIIFNYIIFLLMARHDQSSLLSDEYLPLDVFRLIINYKL